MQPFHYAAGCANAAPHVRCAHSRKAFALFAPRPSYPGDVTLEYAELSCEAGFLAGKVARVTGSDAVVHWLRLNAWNLTRPMLEELKQQVVQIHRLDPAALELTDQEREEIRAIPQIVQLCPAQDAP